MKNIILLVLTLFFTTYLDAQNLYPKKIGKCAANNFCLDCGDIKATVDSGKLSKLVDYLNNSNNLNGVKGRVMFQILVDATGKGCVLSHTDVSDNIISRNIVAALNNFDGFIPARTKDHTEERTSFNMSFEIENGRINAKVERVDIDAFKKSFDRPNSPEIYNKEYVYKNENLSKYKIAVWNSANSNLPDNMNDHITIDEKGIVWLTAGDMLVRFNGKNFEKVEARNEQMTKPLEVYTIASDNKNRKWVYGNRKLLSFDDKDWILYDQTTTGITETRKIIFNSTSDELFFCSAKGLTIFKNGVWSYFNKDKKYPFGDIYFAKRDRKNQIWIGTFDGSYLIDANGNCIIFNETNSVLNGQCITAMDEDENGNLYFCLYEYGNKSPGAINRNEGIAIKEVNGTWKQYTSSNSGMPFNHATDVLYDKKENVLWISTDRAGLVRYDLKDGWENYHSENSEIPTSYISAMTFDKSGALYLATRQGLVRLERR